MLTAYLNTLKNQGNFTYEAIANLSGVPEATVKNILTGKTEDPRFETVSAIVKAMGGSLDAVYSVSKKEDIKENSVLAIKETYEQHIEELTNHYENRIKELKERHEERIAEINEHIETIKLDKRWFRIATCACVVALVGFFMLETLTPGMGWVKY